MKCGGSEVKELSFYAAKHDVLVNAVAGGHLFTTGTAYCNGTTFHAGACQQLQARKSMSSAVVSHLSDGTCPLIFDLIVTKIKVHQPFISVLSEALCYVTSTCNAQRHN